MQGSDRLRSAYGPWALVAGASEGLGLAFAEELGAAGFNLVLVARREALLRDAAHDLTRRHGVEVHALAMDLGGAGASGKIAEACADLEVGLVVYNAAYAPRGRFADIDPGDLEQIVAVNVRGPLLLVRALLPQLVRRVGSSPENHSPARTAGDAGTPTAASLSSSADDTGRRAGIILMSSLAGNQGSPGLAGYAASKAFTTVLAESLWHELRPTGVDVLGCIAGAVRTPGLRSAMAAGRGGGREAPGTLDAERVVRAALRRLGRGAIVVPGLTNKLARFAMTRLFSKRAAIGIMAASTRGLGAGTRQTPGLGPQQHQDGDKS